VRQERRFEGTIGGCEKRTIGVTFPDTVELRAERQQSGAPNCCASQGGVGHLFSGMPRALARLAGGLKVFGTRHRRWRAF
jgi:hypothetical protein